MKRIVSFKCAEPNCKEYHHISCANRKEVVQTQNSYSGKWECTRHASPEKLLSTTNQKRYAEAVALPVKGAPGLYWHGEGFIRSGFCSGPGFKAFAKDFPEGTKIQVKIRVVLPEEGPPAQEHIDDCPTNSGHPVCTCPQKRFG